MTGQCAKCGTPLRQEVAGGFCSACLLEEGLSPALSPLPLLRSFGDYELLEEIARGGMGVVYKARQKSLNRWAAVKMILSGHLASPAEAQRFRAEAQAAAALQHPGIVGIHEVGEHEGMLFFSMDFVEGRNLAQLVQEGPFAPPKAAACLRQIAEAIHYAHEQDVLHRDLKPSNVLIDSSGHPRVTDFGLARRLTDTSGLTLTGQILGTPGYMAPEQAAARHEALGPATDVYALGAILYELLTGRPPFAAATPHETLNQVLQSEPVAPRLLNSAVPRDLETVCLKCLEKEPIRRYQTARALAEDLGRFLRHEPVRALPPSKVYRAGKFARRHRFAVAMAAGVALTLLTATVVSTVFGFWANEERKAALKAQAEAKSKAEEAKAVLAFFETSILAAGRPAGRNGGLGINATVAMAVDAAAKRVGSEFAHRPLVEADIRDVLGTTYYDLGSPLKAIHQFELALALRQKHQGQHTPDTLQSLNNLGTAYLHVGKYAEATNRLAEAARHLEATLGPANPKTISGLDNLASAYVHLNRLDVGLPLRERVVRLAMEHLGATNSETLGAISNLSEAYARSGQLDKSIDLLEKTLKKVETALRSSDDALLSFRNNLAVFYARQGRLTNAIDMLHTLIKAQQSFLPTNHPAIITTMANLGSIYKEAGNYEDAQRYYEQALSLSGTNRTDSRSRSLTRGLASILRRQGMTNDAFAMLIQLVDQLRVAPSQNPSDLPSALNSLGVSYLDARQWSNAIPVLEEAVKLYGSNGLSVDPEATTAIENLAAAYRQAGRPKDAADLLTDANRRRAIEAEGGFEKLSESSGTDRQVKVAAAEHLKLIANLHARTQALRKEVAPGDSRLVDAQCRLFTAYHEDSQLEPAARLLQEILASESAWAGQAVSNVSFALDNAGRLRLAKNDFTNAETLFRENLRILEKTQPGLSPTFVAEAMLGAALFSQKRYKDAEPHLIYAYDGLKQRDARGRPNPSRAKKMAGIAQGLTELYEATGNINKAAEWRQRTATPKAPPTQ